MKEECTRSRNFFRLSTEVLLEYQHSSSRYEFLNVRHPDSQTPLLSERKY